MYSTLYRTGRLLWPGGLETRRHLRELERLQWLPREELEAWQWARIQRLVAYAYEHVPYYRKLYQRLDIHPADIRHRRDFQALPFLTKEDINADLDSFVSSEFRGRVQQESTGGSTGEPMQFFIDRSFWWWNAAYEFRGRSWHGVHEGDKMAWVWGAQKDMHDSSWPVRLKASLMRHRYLNAFNLTESRMQAFAEMLVRWKPAVIRAYASALSLFARYIKEQGITGFRPKMIETTAEKVTDPQRELLEDVFQCKVADVYAGRELATIAYPCEAGGLHVCETRHVEIVSHGEVAPSGALGEVAITSLHQFAMPLIRYKMGDMALTNPTPCPCGRGMPLLKEVVGRLQDFVVTGDGQFVHGGYFVYIFRLWPDIVRYQVYQPDKQHLEVRFVCRKNSDLSFLDAVREELQQRFGTPMEVSLHVVDEIPLTRAGKHRFIISDVKPDFIDPGRNDTAQGATRSS